MRYFDFPCGSREYIYHTNYGFFTSKRKTDDNDKLVVAPNYNLFHNKYLHFQAIVSPLMMNKNLLDDEGEDQKQEVAVGGAHDACKLGVHHLNHNGFT